MESRNYNRLYCFICQWHFYIDIYLHFTLMSMNPLVLSSTKTLTSTQKYTDTFTNRSTQPLNEPLEMLEITSPCCGLGDSEKEYEESHLAGFDLFWIPT